MSFFRSFLSGVLAVSALFAAAFVHAQTPIAPTTWTGSPASATGPSAFTTLPATTTPGAGTIAISQWDRGATTFNAAGGCYNSKDWQVGGSLAAAQAANRCIFFTVTNSATTELQVTRLFIRSQVSATGPQNVQVMYTIGTTNAAFGPTISTAHTASPENWDLAGNICIEPGQTATFRLYGWGGPGAAGTLRINDGTAITAGFATPVTATATSNSPICAGTDLYLTGTATGGIPGYTYSWAGPGGFSSAILSPTVTAAPASAAGVYTLTVTDALNCTTSSVPVTTTVTVNTAPAPITGTAIVCPLLTTTLTSTSTGGTWTSSNTGIATVDPSTGVVTGIAAGTATITYQLSSLCITTRTVTVDAPPAAITGGMAVCVGLTTTLNSTTGSGAWSSSDATIATVTAGGVATGIAPGTANITYTIPSGCIATATITVNSFPAAIAGTTTVCIGATTTLTNASGGGSWSSQDITIATVDALGVVTGMSAGTTNITYTLSGGCYVTTPVTVNPQPGTISGINAVCEAATTTLTTSSTTGTWTSGATGTATVGAATGIVTGVAAGTVDITYTLPSGCYRTHTMTVNPIPAAITGPSGVCLGTTATLNSATAGGEWHSANSTTASVDIATGVVTGNTTGTVRISYILASTTGCFITRIQTVHPLPATIAGADEVCPGLTTTLSSTPTTGTWTSSNTGRATVGAGTGIVTGVSAGTVVMTYTLPTGCIATKEMTVNPAPPAIITPIGDTTFCPGGSVVLTANTGTSLTHQWFVGASPIGGATGINYVASTTGSYRVRVSNSFGCPTFSVPISVLVNTITATISVPGGSTTACSVSPITLNASPTGVGFSYQWLHNGTPITGASGSTHAASITGDYSVIVTNITGCSDESGTIHINILPSPSDAVTLSGPATFCAGSSVMITATSGTGYVYQWYNGATPIPGATSISYTTSAPGSYYAQVTNSIGCTNTTVTTNVIVDPLPDVSISSTGPRVVCAGSNVTLTAAAGSYNYQWYKSGVAIPGATDAIYTTTVSGGFRVRVTNTITGCTAYTGADTLVTIVAAPVIVALTPTKFCWGGSALLSTSVSGAGSLLNYQWSFNGSPISGATSPTYNAGTPGNYRCTVTVPSSCTATTMDITVSQMPLPNPIVTFNGVKLFTGTHYVSYQWYKDLTPIPGATAYNTAHTGNGNYKVRVVDTNGCQSISDMYVVKGMPTTGVVGTSDTRARIYPNPAQGMLFIESDNRVSAILRSIDGRELIHMADAKSLDLSTLPNGMYILTLYDEDHVPVQIEKVVKQ
ncbi:hypothetical protein GCM10023093_01970 [Nemorincola caseinilytica]|uniref:BIG2 domain-containing protein n=1 Tax=Nemorincola caseinilytica TaxID=2054315 RepID=A0ABP8N553_9BACT